MLKSSLIYIVHALLQSILVNLAPDLRSFTLPHPKGPTHGSSIGVVLYQKAFYVARASSEKVNELMGREVYPTGSMQVPWEKYPSSACS